MCVAERGGVGRGQGVVVLRRGGVWGAWRAEKVAVPKHCHVLAFLNHSFVILESCFCHFGIKFLSCWNIFWHFGILFCCWSHVLRVMLESCSVLGIILDSFLSFCTHLIPHFLSPPLPLPSPPSAVLIMCGYIRITGKRRKKQEDDKERKNNDNNMITI